MFLAKDCRSSLSIFVVEMADAEHTITIDSSYRELAVYMHGRSLSDLVGDETFVAAVQASHL